MGYFLPEEFLISLFFTSTLSSSFFPSVALWLIAKPCSVLGSLKPLFLQGSLRARKANLNLCFTHTHTLFNQHHTLIYNFLEFSLHTLQVSMLNLFCPWSLRAYKHIKEWVKASVMKACVKSWTKTDL